MTSAQQTAISAILAEREHQVRKWGYHHKPSVADYLIVLEAELEEAKIAYVKDIQGDHCVLAEIVQVAAVALACLEAFGVVERENGK